MAALAVGRGRSRRRRVALCSGSAAAATARPKAPPSPPGAAPSISPCWKAAASGRSNRRKSNAKSASATRGIKILKIVEEGYEVTPEDIRTNKVLVELDSSDLQKQIVQQDIQFESAAASLTDAQQNYEIQLNQNLSDIKAAEQKVRFARMDFDKFLGDRVTQAIVDQLGLEQELATEQTNALARSAAVVASLPSRAESRQAPAAGTNGADPKPVPSAAAGAPTNCRRQLAATATPSTEPTRRRRCRHERAVQTRAGSRRAVSGH